MPELEDTSLNHSVDVAEEAAAASEQAAAAANEEFDKLLDSYSTQLTAPPLGELIKGRVVKIAGDDVIVDIGYKSEGLLPGAEFKDADGAITLKPGDEIDVTMDSTEERDGYVMLSRERAKRNKAWDDVEAAFEKQTLVNATVLEKIKGGLAVEIGVRAFLPGSQIDVRPVRNLDELIGKQLECKIIKLNKKRSNVVVSRKVVLEAAHNEKKEATLAHLVEGAVVTGTVKNLTDYGVFLDLGGIDGLLHVTDLSWGRIAHPKEMVKIGDELSVKVLKFDREKERVSLGLKQLTEDPWASVAEKYPAGSRVAGKVLSVTDYGAFIALGDGVEGLVHVSEMSWSKRVKHPSKMFSVGQEVEAVVLDVNPKDRRISLGIKQTTANPWETLQERYAIGTVVKGRVRNMTDFGAFVEVEDGIDGLVHVSDISWTKRIKHPSEALKKGEMVQAAILSIDVENRRLSLGIKQLEQDAWQVFCERNQIGDLVKGKVARKATFGVFVELAEGIEGMCHISEISHEKFNKDEIPLEIGQEYEFKILKMTPTERKIGLSIKATQAPPAKPERPARREREAEKYVQPKATATATNTIGDMMAMKEKSARR